MIKGIPWQVIGPALSAVIVILVVVFGFILKLQKVSKPALAPPKDINSTGKKTLCFEHHKDIGKNQTAIEMIGEQQLQAHKDNREDHDKIETKIETLGKDILQAIDENSVSG